MKSQRSLLLIFVLIFSSSAGIAQESGYGISLGLVNSSINFSGKRDVSSSSSITQPSIGIFGFGQLAPKVGLFTEVAFNVVGTDLTDSAYDPATQQSRLKNESLRLWMFRWSIGPTVSISDNFFAMGGAVLDIVTKRSIKDDDVNNRTVASSYVVGTPGASPFKGGVFIGAGAVYKILRFDLRYTLGLGNLIDASAGNTSDPVFSSAKYNTFQATVGIVIPGMHLNSTNRRKFFY